MPQKEQVSFEDVVKVLQSMNEKLNEEIYGNAVKLDNITTSHYELRQDVRRHEAPIYDLFQGHAELKKQVVSPKTSRPTSLPTMLMKAQRQRATIAVKMKHLRHCVLIRM